MFAPFEQVDTSMTRRHGGTGLGLAISRQLVELLGGELRVDSTPDVGSCFSFAIEAPMAVAGEPVRVAAAEEGVNETPLRDVRLLVVDDIEINTLVASAQASALGAEVTSVLSGDAALTALETASFDLVLMDLHMPDMDGLETTRRIRARADGATLPIVAMSASVHAEEMTAAREAGLDDFLSKPFEESELIDVVLRNLETLPA